jgi:L-arabinose isomerase
MHKPRVGLLPLYIELYDKSSPQARPGMEAFYRTIAGKLREAGLDSIEVPVCRITEEFKSALAVFEKENADAVVTLHLAYSPSLESAEALKHTALPLIILDTTPDYTFDRHTPPARLLYNHGIHGVQDMCNLLVRNGKRFVIHAGHWEYSDVIARTAASARAAKAVTALKKARVGIIGEPFQGMGDFRIPFDELKNDLGVTVVRYDFEKGAALINGVTREAIDSEYERDSGRFVFDEKLSRETYDRSARTCLGVRQWIGNENLSAFTVNFGEASKQKPGFPVMPFTECSTAMSTGIGYAGEGDVLTAAFVGALLSVYPETSFTEIFCPDWEHGSLFLSHMGELNFNTAAAKPFITERAFPFTDADNPTVAYASFKAGKASIVNVAPFGNGAYRLIITKGAMLPVCGENSHSRAVSGWFKPGMELAGFLEEYSRLGGTHHSALVYGDNADELALMGEFSGWETRVIGC